MIVVRTFHSLARSSLSDLLKVASESTKARRWADAEGAWREVLSANPNDPNSAVELSEALRSLRRFAEADQTLRRFVRAGRGQLRVLVAYARNATSCNDSASAIERWRNVLDVHPDYFEAHLRLALLSEQVDGETAAFHFERAQELSPYHHDLVKPLAAHFARRGNGKAATTVYEKAIERFPDDQLLRIAFARLLLNRSEFAQADAVLEHEMPGIRFEPRWLEARISCDVALKRWPAAIEQLKRWLGPKRMPAAAAAKIWEVIRGASAYPEALPFVLDELVFQITAYSKELVALARAGHSFSVALQILSANSGRVGRTLLSRAELLADLRDYAEAEQIARRFVGSKSQVLRVQALRLLDRVLAAGGRWQECVAVCQDLLKELPRDAEGYRALGDAYDNLGDFTQSESAFLRAMQVNPGDVETLFALGRLSFWQNESRLAQSYFRNVVTVAPTHAEAQYHLGMVSEALDDPSSAIDSYLACLAAAPGHSKAFQSLLKLESQEAGWNGWQGHLADLQWKPAKGAKEWGALAALQLTLDDLNSAIKTLEEAECAVGFDVNNVLLLAHSYRLAGRLDNAEAEIRRVLTAAPLFYRAFDEFVQILCAQGRFEAARTFVDEHLRYFESTEFRGRAVGILTHVLFGVQDGRSALAVYRASRLSQTSRCFMGDKHVNSLSELSPNDRLLVLPGWGLGDELIWSVYYSALASWGSRLLIACEPRITRLLRRSFPDLAFAPSERWMELEPLHRTSLAKKYSSLPNLKLARLVDNAGWDAVQRYGKVAIMANLLPDFWDPHAIRSPQGHLRPDPHRIEVWSERLSRLGPGLKVGIAWSSLRSNHQRRPHLTRLDEWQPLLKVSGINFVCLDPAGTDAELAAVRKLSGVEIIKPEDLNLRDDLDESAALLKALDLVICVANNVSELAGAVGASVWVLNRSRTLDWRVADAKGTDRFHPNKIHLFADDRHNIDDLMATAAVRLANWALSQKGILH